MKVPPRVSKADTRYGFGIDFTILGVVRFVTDDTRVASI
jgi:hypothetical protein